MIQVQQKTGGIQGREDTDDANDGIRIRIRIESNQN